MVKSGTTTLQLQSWPGVCLLTSAATLSLDTSRHIVKKGRKKIYPSKLVDAEPGAHLLKAIRRAIAEPGTVSLPLDLIR